jgi:hypothetical protein
VKPGLSSYTSNPQLAAQSIRDLLDHALDHVPQTHWRTTPVFLKATAGLRTVTEAQAAEILDHCAEAIARTVSDFFLAFFVFLRTINRKTAVLFSLNVLFSLFSLFYAIFYAFSFLLRRFHFSFSAHY